jgi:integrase
MARTVRDTKLETRAARERLRPRGKPYWRELEPGCHLGYRRLSGKAGRWCARHYAGQQVYVVETIAAADDYSDADGVAILSYRQAQAKTRERMVARAHHAAGKTGPLTVAGAIKAYLAHLADSGKAIDDARYRADALILPTLGEIEVSALSTDKMRNWLSALAKTPPRLRTRKGEKQQHRETNGTEEDVRRRRLSANRVLTIFKAALNHAFNDGKVTSDVAWRKLKPFKGVDAARIRYLSVAEAKRLINASDLEFRPLVHAALLTGARYGQIAQLAVSDFNPDVGTVRLRSRKGDGSEKVYHAHLTDEGRQFFKQACVGRTGADLVFTKRDGSAWGKSHQKRPIEEASARAKISPPANFHVTRHTFASHAVMNGVPLLVVAKNLGHSDTRMVERHYGHLAPSYIADAIRAGAPRFGFKPDRKITALSGR